MIHLGTAPADDLTAEIVAGVEGMTRRIEWCSWAANFVSRGQVALKSEGTGQKPVEKAATEHFPSHFGAVSGAITQYPIHFGAISEQIPPHHPPALKYANESRCSHVTGYSSKTTK